MKKNAFIDNVIWYAVTIVILVTMLFPIYWMFMVSLKLPEEIFKSPPIWFPKTPQFSNFAALFIDGDVWSLWNSLVIAGVSTIIAMVLFQAAVVGLIGYSLGIGLAALFGELSANTSRLAFLMPWQVLVGTGVSVLLIVLISSVASVRRVLVLEPAVVFQGA